MDGNMKLSQEQEALRQYRYHLIEAWKAAGRLPNVEDRERYTSLIDAPYLVVTLDDRFKALDTAQTVTTEEFVAAAQRGRDSHPVYGPR